jgi:long-chain acyl-CoA synthetase
MEIDLELYREDVLVSSEPKVRLSVIDVKPAHPRRTIVFLHGFGGKAIQWVYQLKFFSDENRVIAPDLRGHGSSDKPASEYSMEEILKDIETSLEALGVEEKFVLAGHSFGGAIATSYAVAHPERVEKLILISTAGDFPLGPLVDFVFKLPTTWLEPFRSLVRKQLSAPVHVLKRFYHNALSTWNGWPLFRSISVPTLVIKGHRDIVFPKASFEEVPKRIPGAKSVVIPVSAHLVQLERPDAVNRAIQRFLEEAPTLWRETIPKRRLVVERPWLRHYDKGVPYTIGIPNRPLHRLLERAAKRFGKSTAIIFYGKRISYRKLDELANRFANSLLSLGVRKGDRVMILLPNIPQAVISCYGALKAGAIVVFSNPLFEEGELLRQINDSEANTLVTMSLYAELARRIKLKSDLKSVILTDVVDYLPLHRRILFKIFKGKRGIEAEDESFYGFQSLLRLSSPTAPDVEVSPGDVAIIEYTGGTTALPKGVMLTHSNLVANTLQTRHWIPDLKDGKEVFLSVLPFSHVYGMTAAMNAPVSLASAMILLPTFVTEEVLKSIKKYKPTIFPGVPAMYVAINNYPNVRKYGISSIRACISGAAPLPIEVQEAFEKLTKGRLVEGYGLTEASPVTHANPLNGLRKVGSIGIPIPSTEAKIVDIETGEDLPPGEIGELLVRGPQVMKGYWKMPERTADVIKEGWLHTGDIASMDEEGYFRIISRKKEMITAGQYKVYPRDVEEVIYEHPKVKEVAVVGVPPGAKEQTVKAYIVPKEGEELEAEEIISFCEERMEEYQVPKEIEFRKELPKSFVGKVLRRLLT